MSAKGFVRGCAVMFAAASVVWWLPIGARTAERMVFEERFEGSDALRPWQSVPSGVRLAEGRGGTQGLLVERSPEVGSGSTMVRLRLSAERMKGERLVCEAYIRAEGVAKPPQPWNGVKFMIHTVSPSGNGWYQRDGVWGTFDWRRVRFTCTVPRDASEVWLMLGIEETVGRAWFDDISIRVRERAPAVSGRPGPVYKGHNLPRLRGAMIGTQVGESDLRVLGGEWKANHVRWQLVWNGFPQSPADTASLAEYARWLDGELKRLDSLLPVCEELGIRVLIDLHTPPGGRDAQNVCRVFQERRCQEEFLQIWTSLARRYRNSKAVWGYDLLNEPVEGDVPEGLMDWQALAERAAKLIRAVDTRHAIVVEPAPWGGPDAIDNLDPLPVRGVVYSVHMYQPFRFTHQGIYGNPTGVRYPGEVDGVYWDKERLRRALAPVREFQQRYRVHIYIGEFSAIRWAPGESGRDYLRDLIDIFEEYGWDWAYHAFREWDGWSVEHGPDPNDHSPSKEQTSREKLLRSWFAKNRR